MDALKSLLRTCLSDNTHEGYTPFVYLDTKGNLTVGTGHNYGHILKDVTRNLLKKELLYRAGKLMNTTEVDSFFNEIKAFYIQYKQANGDINYTVRFYKKRYSITIDPKQVEDKLAADIRSAITDARTVFRNFSKLPVYPQAGLAIIAFAMGRKKLMKFAEHDTNFKQLVETGKFREAATWIDSIRAWQPHRKKDVKSLLLSRYHLASDDLYFC